MNRDRWRQIDRIFEAVLERPAADRPAFLSAQCSDDQELRAEVQSLLLAHDQQDSFLEQPVPANGIRPLADDDASTLIGEMIANYRIVRPLGTGGVSEVYLAQDERLARPVAIKLLARRSAGDRDNVRRFRREALAASALNHPNIVTVHEIGEWQGRDFIAAEFVDGLTLREYMRQSNPPVAVSLDIALQIASALAAAHSAGIVHRDIKPENVMVRPDGLVKVLDFGIAKRTARGEAGSDTGTADGLVIGTVAYMSPEQARGQDVDARTDIWSLGVLLYEMLVGRVPFAGETPADRIAAILGREPEPVRAIRREIPAAPDAIIRRALAKNRDERYPDAATLATDIRTARAALGNEPRLKWPMRSRKWAAAALLAIMAIGLWHMRPGIRNTRQIEAAATRETIASLAVLPFANAGFSTDTEYLSDGITDTLINDLSEIPQLKVMSRSSVFRYKGQNADAQKIGQGLQVRTVLTGRVLTQGNDLSVTVELVDTRDNSHIWGDRYQRRLSNVVDLEQDIARDITEKLRLRLSKEDRDRLARRPTNNAEAYQAYLKGRFYWFKRAFPTWRPGSAPDFSKSRDYYQQAIEADPGYAHAYAGLGHYYAMSAANGLIEPEQAWSKAEAAFNKALELDTSVAAARTGLAVTDWVRRRDWASAEKELRLAIQMNPPDRPEGLYARVLAAEGRFDESIAQIRRGIEFDPLSMRFISTLGIVYYYARRYEESVRQYRQALELDANDVWVHEMLGDAYERAGRHREAVVEWRTALILAGDRERAAALDAAFRTGGFTTAVRALARANLQRFAELKRRGEFVPAIEYARAYWRLGQKEQAFEWLAKTCDEHTLFALFIKVDPFYDGLRQDPRFREIISCLHIGH